jgi:hypothetical protein
MSTLAEPWMDDLEARLSTAAGRVTERLGARRRTRRVAGIALAIALVLGSVALAQTTSFRPIESFQGLLDAQREKTPADAIPSAVRRQFARARIYGLQIDETRLMGTFAAGDARLYAAATRAGKLCLVLVLQGRNGVLTCGGTLGPRVPLMAVMIEARPGTGPVFAGVARDDVRALVLTSGGKKRTVPVQNGAFFYAAAALTRIGTLALVYR